MAPATPLFEYQKLLDYWAQPTNHGKRAVVSIDLEKWTVQTTQPVILQVGVRIDSTDNRYTGTKFFRFAESFNKQQRYCLTNPDGFKYAEDKNRPYQLLGKQQYMGEKLRNLFDSLLSQYDKVILVGWGMEGDLAWIRDGLGWEIPREVVIIDAQAAFMHAHGIPRGRQPSLRNATVRCGFDVDESDFHNAGNDAHWTGEVFLYMGKKCGRKEGRR